MLEYMQVTLLMCSRAHTRVHASDAPDVLTRTQVPPAEKARWLQEASGAHKAPRDLLV